MITDRVWLAPTWVRWMVSTIVPVPFVVAYVVWLYPIFIHRAGWFWTSVAIVALCGWESGMLLYARRDARRRTLADLAGLSYPQRLEAFAALRTGTAPADAAALVAALAIVDRRRAYQRGAPRWQRWATWVALAVAIVGAFAYYLWSYSHVSLAFAVFAAWFARQLVRRARYGQREPKIRASLRAAAGPDYSPPDDGEVAVALTKRRMQIFVAGAAIPMMILVFVVAGVDRPRPDCRLVSAEVTMLYNSRQLTEPQSVNWASPDLNAYQHWSDEIREFSRRASNPAVAPHLHRLADLSVEAVTDVRIAGSAPVEDAAVKTAKTNYYNTLRRIVDNEDSLIAYCS